jgi:hypothetical protein
LKLGLSLATTREIKNENHPAWTNVALSHRQEAEIDRRQARRMTKETTGNISKLRTLQPRHDGPADKREMATPTGIGSIGSTTLEKNCFDFVILNVSKIR